MPDKKVSGNNLTVQKPNFSRSSSIAYIILAIVVFVVFAGGCIACNVPGCGKNSEDQNKIEQEAAASYDILGEYKGAVGNWTAIVIGPDANSQNLVQLAKNLHNGDPEMRYAILDAKPSDFKRWKKNEVTAEDSKMETWNDKHFIAMINQMFEAGVAYWRLEFLGTNVAAKFSDLETTDLE